LKGGWRCSVEDESAGCFRCLIAALSLQDLIKGRSSRAERRRVWFYWGKEFFRVRKRE
jgi:hypothetical protein